MSRKSSEIYDYFTFFFFCFCWSTFDCEGLAPGGDRVVGQEIPF